MDPVALRAWSSRSPLGLGAGATFAYDTNPKYSFANASFTKGSIDAGVWDNGKYPSADVLALAHKVYAALPSAS